MANSRPSSTWYSLCSRRHPSPQACQCALPPPRQSRPPKCRLLRNRALPIKPRACRPKVVLPPQRALISCRSSKFCSRNSSPRPPSPCSRRRPRRDPAHPHPAPKSRGHQARLTRGITSPKTLQRVVHPKALLVWAVHQCLPLHQILQLPPHPILEAPHRRPIISQKRRLMPTSSSLSPRIAVVIRLPSPRTPF